MTNLLISLHQYSDLGLFILRFALGTIFWVHGTGKLKMWKMTPSEQMPKKMINLMRLLSICEPLGALAMFSGFLVQPAALGFSIIMLGAINAKITKWKTPFWAQTNTGWEFDFLILATSIALIILGAGAWSLDSLLGL